MIRKAYNTHARLSVREFTDTHPAPLRSNKGGIRPNAGRKSGEATAVIRIPSACLNSVTEIILTHRTGGTPANAAAALDPVTEIKDDGAALAAMSALRGYFRSEYLMGDSDIAFSCWIENTLNPVIATNGEVQP